MPTAEAKEGDAAKSVDDGTCTDGKVPGSGRLLDALARAEDGSICIPASVERKGGGQGVDGRRRYLGELLHRDPALFLERHGKALGAADLSLFEHLRGDYEVNFHVSRLLESLGASPAHAAARASRVKNRRLAHMRHLDAQGYFAEDNMRLRAPLLYETYVGVRHGVDDIGAAPESVRGADDSDGDDDGEGGCGLAYAAHSVSMRLLEAEDERDAAERLVQARRAAAAQEAAEEEESDSDDDDDDDDNEKNNSNNKNKEKNEKNKNKSTESNGAAARKAAAQQVMAGMKGALDAAARRARRGVTREELRRAMLQGWGHHARDGATGAGADADGPAGAAGADNQPSASSQAQAAAAEGGSRGEREGGGVGGGGGQEEEEEEEGEEEERNGGGAPRGSEAHAGVWDDDGGGDGGGGAWLTDEQLCDRLSEFERVMRERYLTGEDGAHVDYARIDGDETLDAVWSREADRDAEDAYFDDAGGGAGGLISDEE